MPPKDYTGLNAFVEHEFNLAKAEPYGIKKIRDRYREEMLMALGNRQQSDLMLDDPYWDAQHKHMVLERLINGINRTY